MKNYRYHNECIRRNQAQGGSKPDTPSIFPWRLQWGLFSSGGPTPTTPPRQFLPCLRDRCPKLNRSTADITGRSARVSRVNAVDDRSAISQPNATRGACSQRATNNFHTSATRGVRGAGSRRVMSDRIFHASTAARDHTKHRRHASPRPRDHTQRDYCHIIHDT